MERTGGLVMWFLIREGELLDVRQHVCETLMPQDVAVYGSAHDLRPATYGTEWLVIGARTKEEALQKYLAWDRGDMPIKTLAFAAFVRTLAAE